MNGKKVEKIITILKREYGEHRWEWNPEPLDALIGTILSQNTSDVNSHRAFSELKSKFPTWDLLLKAKEREIAKTIAVGGLANIKSKRIKRVLTEIKERVGQLDLSLLSKLPLEGGKKFLDSLPGVGPKTTAIVLMFSFNKSLMPLDTHCIRVSKRLGLIPMKLSVERAHEIMNEVVPDVEKRNFHINLILHGRRICKAPIPHCSICVLYKICPRNGVKDWK